MMRMPPTTAPAAATAVTVKKAGLLLAIMMLLFLSATPIRSSHGQSVKRWEGELGESDWVCDSLTPIPLDLFEEFSTLPGKPDPANPVKYKQVAGSPVLLPCPSPSPPFSSSSSSSASSSSFSYEFAWGGASNGSTTSSTTSGSSIAGIDNRSISRGGGAAASAVFALTDGAYFCMLAESGGEAVLFDAPEGATHLLRTYKK